MPSTLTRTQARPRRSARPPGPAPAPRRTLLQSQWGWLAGGLTLGFLVPFVFADLLDLNRDLYYGIYAACVLLFLAGWIRATGLEPIRLLRRRWLPGSLLGAGFGAVLAAMVLRTEDTTARPDGLELVAAVAWRGIVYGATDGLLLSVFPILAVFAALAGWRRRLPRTIAVGALAVLAAAAMTASYHLGYSEFRSATLTKPLAGSTIWSAPTLLTLSPLGAPIAHVALHVTAVLHSYDTDTFLPPHAGAAPEDAAPSGPPVEMQSATIYLLRGEHLAAVERSFSAAPGTEAAAVEELLSGPTAAEQQTGLTSAIPAGVRLLGLAVSDGTATVDLSESFAASGGSLSTAGRVAQLVFTLTGLPAVDEVVLRLDGRPVEVFGSEGLVLDLPLTRAAYVNAAAGSLSASLLPPVLVEEPAQGAAYTSPLHVRGTASGPFTVVLTDWDGRIVAEEAVEGASAVRGAFDLTLRFPAALYARGALIVTAGDSSAEIPLGAP